MDETGFPVKKKDIMIRILNNFPVGKNDIQ